MINLGNIFAEIPENIPAELFSVLAENSGVRIERIVSKGHASPADFWYDQNRDEFVIVLSGSAVLIIENQPEPIILQKGSWLTIPAGCRHRVDSTDLREETVWLAVHF